MHVCAAVLLCFLKHHMPLLQHHIVLKQLSWLLLCKLATWHVLGAAQMQCRCTYCAALVLVPAGNGEVPLEWNSGSNGYVYWVSSHLGGPLTQLPHVTPAQVRSSTRHTAQIRKLAL